MAAKGVYLYMLYIKKGQVLFIKTILNEYIYLSG